MLREQNFYDNSIILRSPKEENSKEFKRSFVADDFWLFINYAVKAYICKMNQTSTFQESEKPGRICISNSAKRADKTTDDHWWCRMDQIVVVRNRIWTTGGQQSPQQIKHTIAADSWSSNSSCSSSNVVKTKDGWMNDENWSDRRNVSLLSTTIGRKLFGSTYHYYYYHYHYHHCYSTATTITATTIIATTSTTALLQLSFFVCKMTIIFFHE